MRKQIWFLLLFGAVLSAAALSLWAQEEEPAEEGGPSLSGGLDAAVYSSYIWRGAVLNPHGVFQPEVYLSFAGLGASVWGSLDMTATNSRRGDFTEFDYKGFYTYESGDFFGTLKYIYYDYPMHDYDKTQEIGLELSYGQPFSVALDAYYDFDLVKGTYLKPSVAYELEVEPFTLTPEVGIGWSSENMSESNYGVDKNCLADLEFALEAITDLGKGFYFTLTAAYYVLLDKDVRDEVAKDDQGFWGGGSLGFEF